MASWRINHPGALVDGWAFNGTPASFNGRYPGTLVNAPTWAAGPRGRQCIELDGNNQHVNVGDVAELNSASAFTICFWMNQDVIDQTDSIFYKNLDGADHLTVSTSVAGNFTVNIDSSTGTDITATFDYSTVISALSWAHVAIIHDGSQATNATKLVVYVNGTPVTLGFIGTVPVLTPNLAGVDATIGRAAITLDGRLYDFRIYSVPLSRDEVRQIIHTPVPVLA